MKRLISLILVLVLVLTLGWKFEVKAGGQFRKFIIIAANSGILQTKGLQQFIAYKESNFALKIDTITISEIESKETGRDVPEKIRNFIVSESNGESILPYVMLIGNPYNASAVTLGSTGGDIPFRYFYDTQLSHSPDRWINGPIPTDLYYCANYMENGQVVSWDADKDGYYGEYNDDIKSDENSKIEPFASIGRVPFSDPLVVDSYFQQLTEKEKEYPKQHINVAIAAPILQFPIEANLFGFNDTAVEDEVIRQILQPSPNVSITTLYEQEGDRIGKSYKSTLPLNEDNFAAVWNDKPDIVHTDGHGGTIRMIWHDKNHDQMSTPDEVEGINYFNENKLKEGVFFLFSGGCETAQENPDSLFLSLLKSGKVLNVIGSPRWGIGSPVTEFFFSRIFSGSIGDVISEVHDSTVYNCDDPNAKGISLLSYETSLKFNFFGDPSFAFFNSASTITTSSLPNGVVNVPYFAKLQATGGKDSCTWSVISGSLPLGLSLNSSNGIISGIPTTSNTYNFTVQVTNGNQSATKSFSINIIKDSENYLNQWVFVNGGYFSGVYSLSVDPANTQIAYAGIWYFGVFKSTNGGRSWNQVNNGLTNVIVNFLAIDPTNTDTVYAGTWGGVYKSTNGGANWIQINTGLTKVHVYSLAIDPKTTQVIYAGTDGGIFKSTNGGTNWTQINTGLTGTEVYSLAIDPSNTQVIYAGTGNGVFKSTDGGANWTEINNGLTNTTVCSLAIDPKNTQILYAGTWWAGVFESTDAGINWVPINNGLPSNIGIYSLAIDPMNTKVVYAGTWSTETWRGGEFNGIFKLLPFSFTITALAGQGGSISPSGNVTVNYGDSKTFTITPDTGYKIADVKVDSKSVGVVSTYTFEKVIDNRTIEVTFEKEVTQTVIVLKIGSSAFTVNGETKYLDSPPVIKNNRTLLPIRAVIEAFGGTVGWDANEKKVTISLGLNTIELWIGKNTAKVNGTDTPIDSTNPKVVPEIINGRTMLPLRFVTENLGCQLQWDPNTQTITITYP